MYNKSLSIPTPYTTHYTQPQDYFDKLLHKAWFDSLLVFFPKLFYLAESCNPTFNTTVRVYNLGVYIYKLLVVRGAGLALLCDRKSDLRKHEGVKATIMY